MTVTPYDQAQQNYQQYYGGQANQGFDQQMAMQQQMMQYAMWQAMREDAQRQNALRDQLLLDAKQKTDLANQKNESRYNDILSGWTNTQGNILGDLNRWGSSVVNDTNRAYDVNLQNQLGDLASRGLGNSTLRTNAQQGNLRDRESELNRLSDAFLQNRMGVNERFAGNILGTMERRNDVQPDLSQFNDLQYRLGAGGVGTGGGAGQFFPGLPGAGPGGFGGLTGGGGAGMPGMGGGGPQFFPGLPGVGPGGGGGLVGNRNMMGGGVAPGGPQFGYQGVPGQSAPSAFFNQSGGAPPGSIPMPNDIADPSRWQQFLPRQQPFGPPQRPGVNPQMLPGGGMHVPGVASGGQAGPQQMPWNMGLTPGGNQFAPGRIEWIPDGRGGFMPSRAGMPALGIFGGTLQGFGSSTTNEGMWGGGGGAQIPLNQIAGQQQYSPEQLAAARQARIEEMKRYRGRVIAPAMQRTQNRVNLRNQQSSFLPNFQPFGV